MRHGFSSTFIGRLALLTCVALAPFGQATVRLQAADPPAKQAGPAVGSGSPFDVVGQWPNFRRGGATSVAIRPPYAYVGGAVLHVFDISNPASPQRVGGLDFQGPYSSMVLSGDRLVIGNGTWGLAVVDISIPTAPRLVGASPEVSGALAVGGSYAYVGNDSPPYQLRVFDISDPSNLRLAGSYSTWNSVADVALSGHFAYIAINGNPVEVLDISDPINPNRVGSIQVPGSPGQISIAGEYGYVTGSGTGLQTIDFSNPAAPKLIANNDFDGESSGMVVTDDLIQVLTSVGGDQTFDYQTFDRSDPAHPKPLGNYALSSNYPLWRELSGLASAGSFAYVAGGDGLEIIDFSDPAHPRSTGGFDLGGNAYAYDLALSGSYAYLADGPGGMQVIDISDPRNPQRVSRYTIADSVVGIVVINHLACLALGAAGVDFVDISDPLHPRHAGQFSGMASEIAPFGSYLCIHNDDRLQLLDISNPAQPRALGTYAPREGVDLFVSHESTLFLSHGGTNFEVVDWSNPAQPIRLAEVSTDSGITALAVQGQSLYVVGGSDLSIWDVSQPDYPVRVGTYTSPGALSTLTVEGHYAFVNESSHWLDPIVWEDVVLVDVNNPAQPLPVGRSAASRGVPALGRSIPQNDFLFSAQGELGLTVRSLAAPLSMLQPPEGQGVLFGETAELTVGVYGTSPVQYQWYFGPSGDTSRPVPGATNSVLSLPAVWESSSYWVRIKNQSGQLDSQAVATRPGPALDFKLLAPGPQLNGAAQGIALGEHLAYLVAADTFHVIDVSNPAQPTELSQLPLAIGSSAGLAVSEPYACVEAQGGTLQRIDVSDPSHPRLTGRYSTAGATIAQIAVSSFSPTNSRAYLAVNTAVGAPGTDTPGVMAVDLSDPIELKPLSTFRFLTTVDGVAAAGNYALALTGGALQVIDFSDPAHPQLVGSYSDYAPPTTIYRVVISGRYALINLGSFQGPSFIPGLEILDISNPVHPQLLGSARIFGDLMAADGTRALLSTEDAIPVIQVVDFTDPATPALVGAFNMVTADLAAVWRGNAVVRGNNLFVIDDNRFLSMELTPRLRVDVPLIGPGTSTLRWTGAPGVVLQQTHSLASPIWQDLDGTDGRNRIDLPTTAAPAFFRAVRR